MYDDFNSSGSDSYLQYNLVNGDDSEQQSGGSRNSFSKGSKRKLTTGEKILVVLTFIGLIEAIIRAF